MALSTATRVQTGSVALTSGIYRAEGSWYQITLIRGDRVPPYMGLNANYVLVMAAKHHIHG